LTPQHIALFDEKDEPLARVEIKETKTEQHTTSPAQNTSTSGSGE